MIGILHLHNFRNYDHITVEFKTGTNVVIGENGQGKTNLLEALFFLLQGRSMRTSDVEEMIRNGEEVAILEGSLDIGREIRLRMTIDRDGKVQGRRRLDEMQAISFQPDDIWMVKGGPEARRRYLDEVTLEMKRGYKETLKEYQRALKQRNEAIRTVRKGIKGREEIRNWNQLLCRHGSSIVAERVETVKKLQGEMSGLGEKWGKGRVELRYYTSMGDDIGDEEKTMERIEKMEDAEIRRGISLIGPHRDELLIVFAGKNVRRECSQGEQKLVTVMWRIAQARLMEEGTGRKILLLMDDCLSELDEGNRGLLMGEFESWEQVLVTTTDDMPELAGKHKIGLGRREQK